MQYAYLVCAQLYSGFAASWVVHIGCFSYCLTDECWPKHPSGILLEFLKIIIIIIIIIIITLIIPVIKC